jgi:HK97 family phage major capsid protein
VRSKEILKEFEGQELPKEKQEEIESLLKEAEDLKLRAESQSKIEELEKGLERPIRKIPVASEVDIEDKEDKIDHRKATIDYLRKGERFLDNKTLGSIRDPDGGILVAEDMRNELIEQLDDILQIRKLATVIQTNAGRVAVPTFEYTGTINDVAENGTISVENITDAFGKQEFVPHKMALLFKIPRELLEDADFNIEGHLIDHFATRMAEEMEDDYINGVGVTNGLGLLQSQISAVDLTSSATTANTLSILQAPMKLKAQYRRRGVYIMPRLAVQNARSILDGDSRPLWQEQLRAGLPPQLNGFPVVEVERFPEPSANGDAEFIFGDLKYFWIVERKSISVRRLEELYAANDQVGILLTVRYDCAPVLLEAFVRYNRN